MDNETAKEMINETINEEIKVEKKYRQSALVILCYVLAGAMLIYACYNAGNTVHQINEYYSGYGMTPNLGEIITYVAQAMLEPLIHAFTFFIAGVILNAVRKLDPNNYTEITANPQTEEEALESLSVEVENEENVKADAEISEENAVDVAAEEAEAEEKTEE